MARDLTDRQYALGLDRWVSRNLSRAVPLVAPEPRWLAPGQGWPCFFLALVIVAEVAVLAWQIWYRHA